MKRTTLTATPDMVGKYINQCLWSDVNPVGRILAIKGKNTLVCCRVTAGENLEKMQYVSGGFAGHCVNMHDQRYEYTEHVDDIFEVRYSNAMRKQKYYHVMDYPCKFYDYNF